MTLQGDYVLALNAGSSSLKFAVFKGPIELGRGHIQNIGQDIKWYVGGELFSEDRLPPLLLDICKTTMAVAETVLLWLDAHLFIENFSIIGHRVVHGGDYTGPLLITPDVLAHLRSLVPLAPLHQKVCLEIVDLIALKHPTLKQSVSFDTSFHQTVPELHRRFALPRLWHDRGIRKYGFHGLSYEYLSKMLKKVSARAFGGRTILAHLGSGASLCAVKNGKSVETSMGFSSLDGLIMGTRPGTLDAGVLLYFIKEMGLSGKEIEEMLYHQSGLLGVSGISSDMRVLMRSRQTNARQAIDLFCFRITREAGSLISILGGLDAIVFAGGIGENATLVREQITTSLRWIGLYLDVETNLGAKSDEVTLLSAPNSRVEAWLIPTNEEAVIASQALDRSRTINLLKPCDTT